MISIRRETYEKIVKKLQEEIEFYEAVIRKFEKKYRTKLEEFRKKD